MSTIFLAELQRFHHLDIGITPASELRAAFECGYVPRFKPFMMELQREQRTDKSDQINIDSENRSQYGMHHILPLELVQEILSYLTYPDLANLALTSRSFNHFLGDLSSMKQEFMLQELDIRMEEAREANIRANHREYPNNYRFWRICPKCDRLLHHLKFPDGAKRLGCLRCYARFAIKNPQQHVRLRRKGYMTAWAACCNNWCLDDESIGIIICSKAVLDSWDCDRVWRWEDRSNIVKGVVKEGILMPKEIAHQDLCRRKFIDRNCQCLEPKTTQGSDMPYLPWLPEPDNWTWPGTGTDTETESVPVCSRGYQNCLVTGCHFHCSAVDGCEIINNSQHHHFHCLEPTCDGILQGEIILNGTTPQNCDLECNGISQRHMDDGDRWEKLSKILLSPESRCRFHPRQMAITPGQWLTINSMRSEMLQHPPSLRWIKDLAERIEKM